MCGRYSAAFEKKKLLSILKQVLGDFAPGDFEFNASWNIAPADSAPIVMNTQSGNTGCCCLMKWGIQTASLFGKGYSGPALLINVRQESLSRKAYCAGLFENRCIVPASGYYEWKKASSSKQPYYFQDARDGLLLIGGLVFENSYSVITSEAVPEVSFVHGRMPLLFSPENAHVWLNEKGLSVSDIDSLRTNSNSALEFYPVSGFVNLVDNDSAECIRRVSIMEEPELF